jgi:hypothetical protein
MRFPPRLAALLLLGMSAAHAANWFSLDALSAASGLGIEVDTDSLRQTGPRREVVVRVTYPEARQYRGVTFRSVVATVAFECEGRLGGYRDAVFFAGAKGQGPVIAREDGAAPAVPDRIRDLLPPKSLEVLTRAACSRPTPAVP